MRQFANDSGQSKIPKFLTYRESRIECKLVQNCLHRYTITGAYAHRVQPPLVAGYEGLGRVVATSDALPFSLGQHVLPLRGDGTWQQWLNCSGQWLVPVPEDIADDIALRGYINPLAARLMLRRWPVRDQQIILTAAGSDCARL